jgi:putative PEP-CTERM system TPR-repeat lipoprotein
MMRRAAALLLLVASACSNKLVDPKLAIERGLAALEKSQPRTARIEFLNAIKSEPNNPKIRLLQAEAYLALGDGIAAQAEITRARQLGAPGAGTAHLMAHALQLQGRHNEALTEAAAAAPTHAAYVARVSGLAHMSVGDVSAASAAFERAIAAAPEDARTWTGLARFRRSLGDLAGAIAATDRAVALKPSDTEALVLRGELTRSQYGLRAAIPWFDRAIEIDPSNVIALLERAATHGDLGQMQAMLAGSRKALTFAPNNAMAFYLQAMLAARAGNFELARSLHQRTRGAFDNQPAGTLLASAIDYRTGNLRQAVTRLERLVALQPDNMKARRLLAASQWRFGDAEGTVGTLRPLTDKADADSYALSLMGRALAKLGNAGAASHYLARAASPQQRSATALATTAIGDGELAQLRNAAAGPRAGPHARIRLVAALLGRGQGDEALQLAREVQARNPGVPDAHLLVGDALGTRGDFAGAAAEYRKAANLAFTEPVAMRMIEALQRSGQPAAAAQVLQLFREQNPRSVLASLLAAAAHLQARDWAQAIAIYEGLRRRLGDRDAVVLNNLAWAYSESGDYDRAIPLARKAWALDKDNPATADTLGWLLFKSGRSKAEGLALLERASRGAPSDAQIRTHLQSARSS